MKLKMIILTIALVIAAFLGIGFTQANPLKHIHIQKEVTISGTLNEVFEQVVLLKNFPSWSPFLEADPSQKVEVKGADGKVGAQYHWEGNKGKDLGYQEIKVIEAGKYIKLECSIQKPFKANPTFEYTFTETDEGIKVTQDFNLHSSTADAFFMWLFGVKKDMAKMNARGLELLKIAVGK